MNARADDVVPTACDICDQSGFVVVDEDERGGGRVQRCACQAPMLEPLRLAGVPERERGLQEDGLTRAARTSLDHAGMVLERGESVVLLGPTGRAKTAVAVCLLRRAAVAKCSIAWCHLTGWLREIRESYDRHDEDLQRPTERSLMRELVEADVLVIDDVGSETLTAWSLGMLGALVAERDSTEKPTVYTTNLPLEGEPSVTSVYGDRIASRLKRCAQIPMVDGPDLRERT